MTIPSSGTLGLGNAGASNGIGYELNAYYGSYSQIGLGDYYPERLVGQSTNQQIAMSQFYGRSSGVNLYYSWNYGVQNSGDYYHPNYYGETDSQTNYNPGFVINGYSVYLIDGANVSNNSFASGLTISGYPNRYFFNSITGYNGNTFTPSNVTYFYQYGGYTYYTWYSGSVSGMLIYTPWNSNGSGYQIFSYT
jgi:hypothetical protein